MKDVMISTGAGQIGMAIARRMGYGKKIVIGDKKRENALAICTVMNEAGFDAVPVETDISSKESIVNLIHEAQKYGDISMLVNAAGVSPSQAPVETGFVRHGRFAGGGRQGHQRRRGRRNHFEPVRSSDARSQRGNR